MLLGFALLLFTLGIANPVSANTHQVLYLTRFDVAQFWLVGPALAFLLEWAVIASITGKSRGVALNFTAACVLATELVGLVVMPVSMVLAIAAAQIMGVPGLALYIMLAGANDMMVQAAVLFFYAKAQLKKRHWLMLYLACLCAMNLSLLFRYVYSLEDPHLSSVHPSVAIASSSMVHAVLALLVSAGAALGCLYFRHKAASDVGGSSGKT